MLALRLFAPDRMRFASAIEQRTRIAVRGPGARFGIWLSVRLNAAWRGIVAGSLSSRFKRFSTISKT